MRIAIPILTVAGLALFLVLASRSRAQSAPYAEGDGEEPQRAYAARLATNNAAAEAWWAAHPEGVTEDAPSTDDQLIAHNLGCPEGTQFWQRDSISPLCASLCSGDQDCGPDEGRCRILDVASEETMPEILLVDDLTPEDVAWAMEPTLEETPVLTLCDPFWDIEGVTEDALVDLGSAE